MVQIQKNCYYFTFSKRLFFFTGSMFWKSTKKSSFLCSNCGPRPANLCMDGVAVGMLFEQVKDIEMDDFNIPFESPEVLDAPAFN